MSRIRSLKPEFFTDDAVGALAPIERLLFAGLWVLADREGRLDDRPLQIKVRVLPFDNVDVNVALTSLERVSLIQRYSVDGRNYIQIRTFTKHQRPHLNEQNSIIPPPSANAGKLPEQVGATREKALPCTSDQDPDPDPGMGSRSGSRQTLVEAPNAALALSSDEPKRSRKPKGPPEYTNEFTDIWERTGKSGNKFPAFEAWRSVGSPSAALVIEGWQHHERNDHRWRMSNGARHIPHLATWLHARGWEDRPSPPATGTGGRRFPTLDEIQARERQQAEMTRAQRELCEENAREVRELLAKVANP